MSDDEDDRPVPVRPGWQTGRIPVLVLIPAIAAWAAVVLLAAGYGGGVGVAVAALLVAGGVALALEWSTG